MIDPQYLLRSPARRDNGWLQAILLGLMVVVLVTAVGLIIMVVREPTSSSIAAATPTGTAAPGSLIPMPGSVTSTVPGSLGAFDSGGTLQIYAKYLVATIILVAAGVLEMFLIILYAAFFVNDPVNAQSALGLPPATVRVFLVAIIVLIVFVFAILPDIWGSNKAVVLLFGLLSTVVGFYFGSRAVTDAISGAAPTTVQLTLDKDSKSQQHADIKPITGTLADNFRDTLGGTSPTIVAVLISNSGVPVNDSQRVSVADRTGKVEFDFRDVLQAAAPPASYILRVLSPAAVVCDERITLTA
jgi:hypothetical protein